jgi:hypothetical protein
MKRNISSKLLIAFCLLAMFSCKPKKVLMGTAAPSAGNKVTAPAPVSPVVALKAAQLSFNTFSGKATTKLDINGDKNDVTLNIRIAKDKKIWVSVTATMVITVEAARAVITPDSILMIDKIHGLYLRKPFSYLYQFANKQVTYKMLESIFVGNSQPAILNDANANLQPEANGILISGMLSDLVYKMMLNQESKPVQLSLANHNAGQSLMVNNSDFMSVAGKRLPAQIEIQSEAMKKKVHINMRYTKVDLDQPLDYPFSIPEKYKPADEN